MSILPRFAQLTTKILRREKKLHKNNYSHLQNISFFCYTITLLWHNVYTQCTISDKHCLPYIHGKTLFFFCKRIQWNSARSVYSICKVCIMQKADAGRELPVSRACPFVKPRSLDVKHQVQVRSFDIAKELTNVHRVGLKILQQRLQPSSCNKTSQFSTECKKAPSATKIKLVQTDTYSTITWNHIMTREGTVIFMLPTIGPGGKFLSWIEFIVSRIIRAEITDVIAGTFITVVIMTVWCWAHADTVHDNVTSSVQCQSNNSQICWSDDNILW